MYLLTALICFIAVSVSVSGSPSWRTDPPGLPPTTYQMWTFDDDDTLALPEISSNSYGMAEANIIVSGTVHTDLPGWYDTYLGRPGVWHGDLADVTLTIPNQPIPNLYKEVWMEVGCRGIFLGCDVISPQAGVTSLGWSLVSAGQGWETLVFGFRIEPNPDLEVIHFLLKNSGADVDYIIVDTICIPEPTALALLAVGGMLIRKKVR
jgi:hypothetical protein